MKTSLWPDNNGTHITHASKVPQVPGAGRNRPLPKPKAIMRQKLFKTHGSVGRTICEVGEPPCGAIISSEVIETVVIGSAQRDGRVFYSQAGTIANPAYPRDLNAMACGQVFDLCTNGLRRRKAKLINIAAIQHRGLHNGRM